MDSLIRYKHPDMGWRITRSEEWIGDEVLADRLRRVGKIESEIKALQSTLNPPNESSRDKPAAQASEKRSM
jgi:hypothetical protein